MHDQLPDDSDELLQLRHTPLVAAALVRWRRLVARARRDPRPARVWLRESWPMLTSLALVIGSVFALDAWLATCGFQGCPTGDEIRAFRPAEGGRILDRNGVLVGRLNPVRRVNIGLGEIPTYVRDAFVATEDRRFFEHKGLDWRAVVRAASRNIGALGVREGFSTITMQVARNGFVASRYGRRTYARKLMELRVARLLESHLTKDQILELYLNVIYLGNGAYGVEAASRDLFGKSVRSISLPEAALLAALPKGPSSYTPRRNADRAQRRRNLVLALMAQQGYITRDDALRAARQPMRIAAEGWHPTQPDDSYALDAVRALVDSAVPANMRDADLVVVTTLDARAQRAADATIKRNATAIGREGVAWYGRGGADVQGALVAIDPRSGDVIALVGGRTYERGGFNRALLAHRQPGSAFKPFVYAAGLTAGFTPASLVDDDPVEIDDGHGNIWTPANYGDEYEGEITLRRALMVSANAATVRLSRAIGESRVAQRAHDNGITSNLRVVPALALGAAEVTPLELVTAYAPFANGGYRVTPRLVRRIESADGTLLWSSEPEMTPVMDPRDAYQVTSMLRSVVDHGTGHAVRDMGIDGPIAGKTGTTNNNADVWFVGYSPTIIAGVWFGYDTPRPLPGGASGGRFAAPAWAQFYSNGWRETGTEAWWQPPAGMVSRVIDASTGELASEWCPTTQEEWFKPGTEPTEYCREHTSPEEPFAAAAAEAVNGMSQKIGKALRKIFSF
ncbi:MAG: PBP1A family penicillin-binding protein [Gemmatimonadaceae bacterium]|nr:PBP1A family penicillin-binding protein [Gemmatimonadaceae bacterium]NUQ91697.1 PBP1A family penicillin-binding protein [Gemmatimonadaceae bacterium]NUR19287.1 PBP1A family penicillin-binding protein [Gemmatimonadaceae bacterium]NUS96725.1 PBP1A family penicillin-binding protein [Gemmatimonadaceae bacterium]